MKPSPDDVSDGMVDWMKNEIKSSPSRGYDLGKFFFGVSVATVGMLAALEKLSPTPNFDWIFKVAAGSFFVSILIALNLARPRHWDVSEKTDLYEEYNRLIDLGQRHTAAWFSFWLLGFGIGFVSVLK